MQSLGRFRIILSMRSGRPVSWLSVIVLGALECLLAAGCATTAPSPDSQIPHASVVFGRTVTVLTAPSTRRYEPKVRFFELVNRTTQERYKVEVQSQDKVFAIELPAGDYVLSRVQISEGPFLSMADLDAAFQVESDRVLYLGTWRFGVDGPRYGRMLVVSAVQNQEDQEEAERQIFVRYPELAGQPIASLLPAPVAAEVRLYEVMPYPYYPRYYRRHWW
ncbi:MAG: hypothetical protein AB1411_03245 [Nitrospirota bacterium]